MYSKIQLNTANAIKVIASETVPIPDPNSYVAQQSAAGAGDASTQDKFSDAGASLSVHPSLSHLIGHMTHLSGTGPC